MKFGRESRNLFNEISDREPRQILLDCSSIANCWTIGRMCTDQIYGIIVQWELTRIAFQQLDIDLRETD